MAPPAVRIRRLLTLASTSLALAGCDATPAPGGSGQLPDATAPGASASDRDGGDSVSDGGETELDAGIPHDGGDRASDGGETELDGGADASVPHDGGADACVPKTCASLYAGGIAPPRAACDAIDDGCGGTLRCACEGEDFCFENACYCIEHPRATLCAMARTCGLSVVQGRCGPATITCEDPRRGNDADACANDRCGPVDVTGDWCSWTVQCSCSAGKVCDASAKTCIGLTDARDGRSYPVVRIGEQIWMAKNLAYETPTSACYLGIGPAGVDCDRWGRYYTWNEATGGGTASNANPSGVRGICPAGWHLPSDAEFQQLFTQIRNHSGDPIAPHLKISTANPIIAWTSGVTYDSYGFTLLPGSEQHTLGQHPYRLNVEASLWTTTRSSSGPRRVNVSGSIVHTIDNVLEFGVPVRCVRD